MKKQLFIFLFCSLISIPALHAQDGNLSKKEAKKIAADINNMLDQVDQSLEKIDWQAMKVAVNRSLEAIEKNSDALIEIAEGIDVKKLNTQLEKIGAHIEKSANIKEVEIRLDILEDKIEKAIDGKTNK
jgi:hypothetical protein